jgi:dCMP deaminase
MFSMRERRCDDCNVVIGPYERRCHECAVAAMEAARKPLDNNCGICGQGVAVTKSGLCGTCYEPKAPTPCETCGAPVPSRLPLCWPCKNAEVEAGPQPLTCDRCHKAVAATAGGTCLSCIGQMVTPQRPAWDDYFFEMAKLVSTRATCPRASVGVVLVDGSHRVIATGYNGALSGEPHCMDEGVGCDIYADHCMRARHGEESALRSVSAAENTGHLFIEEDAVTAYVSAPLPVCTSCARQLRAAGVTDVKWRQS